jgi:hypothetical protein
MDSSQRIDNFPEVFNLNSVIIFSNSTSSSITTLPVHCLSWCPTVYTLMLKNHVEPYLHLSHPVIYPPPPKLDTNLF